MSRPCPNCGASVATEARFCRLCGTPLKVAGAKGEPVSPRAKTIPLSDEGRTTKGLSAEDGGSSSPDTSRVRRAEMESLLRHTPASPSSANEADKAAELYAAPETSALTTRADGARTALEESLKANLQGSKKRTAEPEPTMQLPAEAAPAENRAQATIVAKAKTNTRSTRRAWQAVALALLLVAVGAAALAFYYSRARNNGTDGTAPISISDQKRRAEENIAEAERLLAAGNVTDAIARLRYAVRLDASNARAHRMLADALERTGNVNEAIDEYRAAVENNPGDEETRLRYADALRRVGRMDEAREIYQKLSSSSSEEVARTAKEKLGQMPSAPTNASNTEQSRAERVQNRQEEEENGANTASSSTATVPGASSNGAGTGKSGNDPVASYNRAMKIIEGKDIRKMNRADLILAYTLFQYAQRGPNGADASRHLRELDNELFVRRKGK